MNQHNHPISIRLYFENGDTSGICESFMDNFNGIVHKIPRPFLYDDRLINEINRPGVYILIGNINGKNNLYIGESENVFDRLKSHEKSSDKGWFSEVIVITSEQDFLNKAKIKYIENELFEVAKEAKRYNLNQTVPTRSTLSRIDRGTLSEFIYKIKLMIVALGYKLFDSVVAIDEINNERVYFYYKKGGLSTLN